ncbi:Uu.00g115670.m01.CDS01 [Anthostomella pinea]|uniref:Uu.00g115670.m01.CDS01 n=1 Tax=Anthostomella pinea TaxID=933095 RepID=A0AAI8VFX4_9PEZI|nr:Uu.00g115670.m01.CDS01 [Anthostomella pinea]
MDLAAMGLDYGTVTAPTCPGTLLQMTEATAAPANVFSSINTSSPPAADTTASSSVFTWLSGAEPTTSPTDVGHALELLSSIYAANPTPNLFEAIGHIITSGLSTVLPDEFEKSIREDFKGADIEPHTNPREPASPIYPRVIPADAPYSFSESKLRSAINIPPNFRYGAAGAPQPVILVGGTGNPGRVTYEGSYIPLLQRDDDSSFADLVWLDIPGESLEDVQTNAEYVAYAIHYIHGISAGRQVAVFGYSQGNVDAQWAYKYWPSTRAKVSDHVGFSPGYHGTLITEALALVPQPPAWLQSTYTSDLVAALNAGGGDSAHVPTTNVYSVTDQVVQPQHGEHASGALGDERGVGVSNILVQEICEGAPAGGFYTHEAILVHPLAYALARDALAHDGPGRAERLDLETVCATAVVPGLTWENILATENNVVYAGAATFRYPGKSWTEPVIKEYAKP